MHDDSRRWTRAAQGSSALLLGLWLVFGAMTAVTALSRVFEVDGWFSVAWTTGAGLVGLLIAVSSGAMLAVRLPRR